MAAQAEECADLENYLPGYLTNPADYTFAGCYGICTAIVPGRLESCERRICENYCTNGGAKEGGDNCPVAGNPINIATGNKYQHEQDYVAGGVEPLRIDRYYNSFKAAKDGRFGRKWRDAYDLSMVRTMLDSREVIRANRADGRVYSFVRQADGLIVGDPDVAEKLVFVPGATSADDRWQYTTTTDEVEFYEVGALDAVGKLLAIRSREGHETQFGYDAQGRLQSVTGPFGYTYKDTANRVATITVPSGAVYQYSYDSKGNLEQVTYPDNKTRRYHYEDSRFPNHLTGVTDERGIRYITWQYDSEGRGILSEGPGGINRHTLVFGANKRVTVTDALNQTRQYDFRFLHSRHKLAAVTGGGCPTCGDTANYTYDANGYLASKTDHNGVQTRYVYSSRGLQESRTEAVGTPIERTITTTWDATYRLPLLETYPEQSLSYAYQGALLQQTTITDLATNTNRKTTYTWNNNGLLSKIDGPRSDVADVTQFAYKNGDLVTITDALKQATALSNYTADGRPKTLRTPSGLVTTLDYDARGRLHTQTAGTEVTTWDYAGTRVSRVVAPDGSVSQYDYDGAGRLTTIEDQRGDQVVYQLNGAGQAEEIATKRGGLVVAQQGFRYDSLGRMTQELNSQGAALTGYQHDGNGQITQITDLSGVTGAVTRYTRDALGRVATAVEADGTPLARSSHFTYTGQGLVESVQDPNGAVTVYGYNGFGERVSEASPDRGDWSFGFDPAGNTIMLQDAEQQTQYQYDALNRRTRAKYADGSEAIYAYTAGFQDRLAQLTDSSGATTWKYDPQGRVTERKQISQGVTLTTVYRYDAAGRLSEMIYPSGAQVGYSWDAERVAGLTLNGKAVMSGISYQPFSAVPVAWQWGNGTPNTRRFDQEGRLTSLTLANTERTLHYDALSRITGLSGDVSWDYTYDLFDRLTASQGQEDQQFSYDPNGNRLSWTAPVPTTYSYAPDSNRLMSRGNQTYQYDGNGNVRDDGRHSYDYDARNRLTAVDDGVIRYLLNGLGERVAKLFAGNPGGEPPRQSLFADVFAGADGRAIDDQTDGLWVGGPSKFGVSAQVQQGQALIKAKKSLVASQQFTDNGDLMLEARLNRGIVWLKDVANPQSIKLEYDGKTTVVLKVGHHWKASQRVEKTITLGATQGFIAVRMSLKNGLARVVITETGGAIQDTGDLKSSLVGGLRYQLNLQAPTVAGVAVDMRADDIKASTAGVAVSDGVFFAYGDTGKLLGEYALDGSPLQETLHLADQPVAVLKDGVIYAVHTDHLGTPRVITDPANTVVWRWDSDPFGTTLPQEGTGADGQPFVYNLRFPGQYYDAETGLHYNYFRDYDPTTGRYAQSDPIGLEGGSNTYGYVEGDPITWSDYDGLRRRGGGNPRMPGLGPNREHGTWCRGQFYPSVGGNYSPPRQQVFRRFPSRKEAKDAAANSPYGSYQCEGKSQGPEQHETNQLPHYHDGAHGNTSKPNVHYQFPRNQLGLTH